MIEDIVDFTPKSSIPKELTLRAYNSKDRSEIHRFTFPLQDTKVLSADSNNALAVEIDGGKTQLIPAQLLNNVGIVKEIKIPDGGSVRNIDEKTVYKTRPSIRDFVKLPFIYETDSSKMSIIQNQMVGTIPKYLEDYKPSEQNKTIPAVIGRYR